MNVKKETCLFKKMGKDIDRNLFFIKQLVFQRNIGLKHK